MNTIIICATILLIIVVICITIVSIEFIKNPEFPRKLRWINIDIMEIKGAVKNISTNIVTIKDDIEKLNDIITDGKYI